MEKRFEYKNDEERQNIIESNSDLFLIREENLLNGDFVVFSDSNPENSQRNMIEQMKNDMDYLILKQEGLI